MKIADPPGLRLRLRVYDKLMIPVMFVLRGFRLDSLMETHSWHAYAVNPSKIDLSMAVVNHGEDHSAKRPGNRRFLFHAPVFGGWRDFGVYEVSQENVPFYVGWLVYRSTNNSLVASQAHRLLIGDDKVRLLDGNSATWGYFFAMDAKGRQIPIRRIGSGRIGDGSFTDVRLF